MSNLNGESLHDWISSEKKRATQDHWFAITDREEAYYQGVLATLEILRQKLSTGQVNPYGDRRPTSD
jgi:hypothetical protein